MGVEPASTPSFVHLHVHSQYSLLEATIRAKELVKRAAKWGMPAVAITDYGNMFGAVEFYLAAKEAGIKPILGLEVFLAPKSRLIKGEDREAAQMPNRRLVLLAMDQEGYRNLCRISSIGYKEGFYYRPRVDEEVLVQYSGGLIALSGGLMGEVAWTFQKAGADLAIEKIRRLQEIYPDRFYLEMNRTGVADWKEVNAFLLEASRVTGAPLVAANDVHYLDRQDQITQEVLICVGSNKTLEDESRYRLGSDQFYFKNPDEMRALFSDLPEVCDRTLEIAERCNLEFRLEDEKGNPIYHLPSYPTTAGRTLTEEIRRISEEGLALRFAEAEQRGEKVPEERVPQYRERLDYELSVIDRMGFNGYFLIVQDFIGWAKAHDIPVGPGRGSGAGSLVAYVLRITDLDPMPYNLIFERFLNPERISMPDFDVDFCQENRGRVINYVTEKYGEASVSQIITYGKLQARAAIRDVGRVMGMTFGEVDVVAKLVPEKIGITLDEALEMEPRLRELMEVDPKVATLIGLALRIEGLVRHAGIHAAGVIIADGEIIQLAPLYRGVEGENVVQYDMKHAEKIGLIKFDFLGLKTLTHIHDALRLVKSNRGKKIATSDISLSDPGIYAIMCRGDTAGIFQFEGEGITDLIRKAKPNCFEDIVAINALYRPGPMDMIPDYLKRKNGETPVQFLFDELEPILKETYGIVVYQEQVQLIAARIANYSLGEADMLRRAMGKKIPEGMAKQKDRFLRGAKESQFDLDKAGQLFDTMAEFAKYGFNKSHAAAYCVVAAYTAYLKNYYPVEFFAALLSTEMSDTDKVVKYVKDAQRHGIQVQPPSVSRSEYKFTVRGEEIFFSLGAIKGVGESAVEAIIEARSKSPSGTFESLEDFFDRVDLRRVNKKTIECLIKAGAFDEFGLHRARLSHGYLRFIERAERVRKDRELGQTSLFMLDEETVQQEKVVLEEQVPWSRSLSLAHEKEVLGFYLSDHPLRGLEGLGRVLGAVDIEGLVKLEGKAQVRLLGLVSSLREIITKKGTRMAFVQLEDLSGSVEVVVFPNAYQEAEIKLKREGAVLLAGVLEKDADSVKILADKVESVEDLFVRTKRLSFQIRSQMVDKLPELKKILDAAPGDTPVAMRIDLPEVRRRVELKAPAGSGVKVSRELIERVQGLFGETDFIDFQ